MVRVADREKGDEMTGLGAKRVFLSALLVGCFAPRDALPQERIGMIKTVKVYEYGTPVGQKAK